MKKYMPILILLLVGLVNATEPPTPMRTSCPEGEGSWDYCSGVCCFNEGDCDTNSDCTTFAKCLPDIGYEYGYLPEVDVCVQYMHGDYVLGNEHFCEVEPCAYGEGDCDGDSECIGDLICRTGAGTQFGYPLDIDVCDVDEDDTKPFDMRWIETDPDFCHLFDDLDGCHEGEPGDLGYCSEDCRCDRHYGDCDDHDECKDDLLCVTNVGAQYGYGSYVDVCLNDDDFSIEIYRHRYENELGDAEIICNVETELDIKIKNKENYDIEDIDAELYIEENSVDIWDDEFSIRRLEAGERKWVGDFDFTTREEGDIHLEIELIWDGGKSLKLITLESVCPSEVCDGIDNDYDGQVDEGLTRPTTCGIGECSGTGYETCVAGIWTDDTCDPFEGAVEEVYDGLDNDCDGEIDEFPPGVECWIDSDCRTDGCSGILCVPQFYEPELTDCQWHDSYACFAYSSCGCIAGSCNWDENDPFLECVYNTTHYTLYRDRDGDNYGNPNENRTFEGENIVVGPGWTEDNTDCDDTDNSIHPNAPEICCDGMDNNCDEQVDEGCDCINGSSTESTIPEGADVWTEETEWDWVLGSQEFSEDAMVGDYSLKAMPAWFVNFAYGYLDLSEPVNMEDYPKLSLWVKGTGTSVGISAYSGQGGYYKVISPPSEWTEYTWGIDELSISGTPDLTNINSILLQGNGEIYIDGLYFITDG